RPRSAHGHHGRSRRRPRAGRAAESRPPAPRTPAKRRPGFGRATAPPGPSSLRRGQDSARTVGATPEPPAGTWDPNVERASWIGPRRAAYPAFTGGGFPGWG